MNADKKAYKLCIYLLKEEIKEYKQALKQDVRTEVEHDISKDIGVEGKVVIGLPRSTEPGWIELLQGAVETDLPILKSKSNRAIVFLHIENRIFALPFGYGKHLLKDEVIDRDFGLRTVLNLVNADKLVSVDKANLNDLTVLTRTQSSRKAKPESFNIDVIRDLLKSVTGEPSLSSTTDIGKLITGNEGVYIIPTINFSDIPDKLIELKKAYESNNYKERFGWIDNIKSERDPLVIEELQNELARDISNKDQDKIHLAPPYLIDWESFEGFSYTPKGELETEFEISNFYESREEDLKGLNWDKLKRLKLFIKCGDDGYGYKFRLWRCLNYQTELNGELYVFALSNWYKVNKLYSEDLKDYVRQIEESDLDFIDCEEGISETLYNKQLADSQPYYKLLDADLVKSDLTRSGIEVCDVISKDMEFIHVKYRRSSATMSHLFAQGKISGFALRRDKTYRKNLRTKFKQIGLDSDLIPLETRHVDPDKYTITFALIENKKRSFLDSLPFFSLLNFRLTAEDLLMAGYNVKVKKIEIK